MTVYYQFENVLSGIMGGKGRDPNLTELKNMPSKEAVRYLMKPGQMKGRFLGACLDSCRIGTMTTCYWPLSLNGFMKFIQKWRNENKDNEALYHEEPIEKLFSRFELPRINHDACPRNKKHEGTFEDSGGRIRCAHRTITSMKPSFIESTALFLDSHSQTKEQSLYESKPSEPEVYDGGLDKMVTNEDEYPAYLKQQEKYDKEEPVEVLDVCYSIIKEPESISLPFETVLRRLNIQPGTKKVYCGGDEFSHKRCRKTKELSHDDRELSKILGCRGHIQENEAVEFTFDGWTMAYYLLRWKQQGNAPWLAEKKEYWPSRLNLRITSED